MSALITEGELAYSILRLGDIPDIKFININENLQQYIENIKIKRYNENEIGDCKIKMLGKNMKDSLDEISYSFPYDELIIELILQDTSFMKQYTEYFGVLILNFALKQLRTTDITKNIQIIGAILEAIIILTSYNLEALPNDFCNCVRSIFYHLACIVIENHEKFEIQKLISLISNFFAQSKTLSSDYYNLFHKLSEVAMINLFSPDAESFLNSLLVILKQKGNEFPQDVLKAISPRIKNGINFLCKPYLSFVCKSSAFIQLTLNQLLEELPNSIVKYACNFEQFIISDNLGQEIAVEERKESNFLSPDEIMEKETFREEIDLSSLSENIPDATPLNQMIPNADLKAKLCEIIEIFSESKIACESLFRAFDKLNLDDSEYQYEMITTGLFVISELTKKKQLIPPKGFLINSALFDPKVTMFGNQSQFFETVSSLKTAAVSLLAIEGAPAFNALMTKLIRYPQMLAEVVTRFQIIQFQLDLQPPNHQTLIRALRYPLLYYQSLEGDEKTQNALNEARLSILSFLHPLLLNTESAEIFMNDRDFVDTFFTLVYEKPVRRFVLSNFIRYYVMQQEEKSIILFDKALSVAQYVIAHLDNPKAINLGVELFNAFTEIMYMSRYTVSGFEDIFPELTAGIVNIIPSDFSTQFIESILAVLTACYPEYKVTTLQTRTLQKVITKLYGKSPPRDLSIKIVQLIAGQPMAKISSTFMIRQPKALKLLVGIFSESVHLSDIFKFIDDLLRYNYENCVQAHYGSFDLFIIDLLFSWRTNKVPMELVESAFSLLFLITSQASSITAVRLFISLLCPIYPSHLPFYHMQTINLLLKMLTSSHKKPTGNLPLLHDCHFEIGGILSESFAEGFTFLSWIYHINSGSLYNPYLFSLHDENDNLIMICIIEDRINIQLKCNGKENSINFDFPIPQKEWILIMLSFKPDENKENYTVSMALNGKILDKQQTPYVTFKKGLMKKCVIGGLSSECPKPKQYTVIGPIGAFALVEDEASNVIYEAGPGGVIPPGTNPILYFEPKQYNEDLMMVNIGKTNAVSRRDSIRFVTNATAVTILTTRIGLDILLPLFAQLNFPVEDGEPIPNLLELLIEIFVQALSMNEDSQKLFSEKNGFEIMSHLLISLKEEKITYQLYLQLYGIYELLTYDPLRKQLIQSLLLNVELWMKCNPSDHKDIVAHWARILCHRKEFTQFVQVDQLLSILKVYYWYDNEPLIAANRCQGRCRGKPLDVKKCREYILYICKILTAHSITRDNFKLIMSHILTSRNVEQSLDLLLFLRDLMQQQTAAISRLGDVVNLIALLQYLFNLDNEQLVGSTIETVLVAHRNGLMGTLELEDHIEIILRQLSPKFVTQQNLLNMINLCKNKLPELFQICSFMAVNLGTQAMEDFMKLLPPNTAFSKERMWAMWIVIGMYKAPMNIREDLIKYMLSCCNESFKNIIQMVNIVGWILGEEVEYMKHDVLLEAAHLIAEGKSEIPIDMFYTALRHFVFFREYPANSSNIYNNYLEFLLRTSPYINRFDFQSKLFTVGTPPRPRLTDDLTLRRRNHVSMSPAPPKRLSFHEDTANFSPDLAEKALNLLNSSPFAVTEEPGAAYKNRRVSWVNLKKPSFDFQQSRCYGRTVVSMMPSDMDKKTGALKLPDTIHKFGLRFNKIGLWLDVDLAEAVVDVFIKNPDQQFAEIILMLSGFLFRTGSTKSLPVLNLIKQTPALQPAFYMNAHQASTSNIDCGITGKQKMIVEQSFECIEKFSETLNTKMSIASIEFLRFYMAGIERNSRRCSKIYNMITSEVVLMAPNVVTDYFDKINQQIEANSKQWSRLWQSMTTQFAPWAKSLPADDHRIEHYKRDKCIGPEFIPVKLRRNYRFNNHMEASLLRDKGDKNTVDELLKKFEAKRTDEYEREGVFKLCEVGGDDKDEKSEDVEVKSTECVIELPCEIINNHNIAQATFDLLKNGNIVLSYESGKVKVIEARRIRSLLFRTRFHHPTAMEVFCSNHSSIFINFPNYKSLPVLKLFKDSKMPVLKMHQTTDFVSFFESLKLTEKWQNRELSNFQYIMRLNLLSGRSFNDVSQYPIYPWIIKDYKSDQIDLNNQEIYRDLRLPVGALNQERLKILLDKVESIKGMDIEPYLYSSGHVCPLTVYLWLIRLEPFTTLHIDIQSGRFDHAARIFSSIAGAFKLVTNHTNDYRELIPEFFCEPEIFINSDHFDLGTINDEKIDDVILPPWAKDAYEFVYMNRKALASDYVSQNINNWIDLIWGYKQTGKNAEEAKNTYMPEMYSSIWDREDSNDPGRRAEIEAYLCHVGQVPPKLFEKPHPTRYHRSIPVTSLPKPLSVSFDTRMLIVAAVQIKSGRKIRAMVIDESGLSASYVYDANTLNKSYNNRHGDFKKQRSRSGSINLQIGLGESKKWKSDRFSVDPKQCSAIEVSPGMDFNSSSRTLKNFSALVSGLGERRKPFAFSNGTFFIIGAQKNTVYRIRESATIAELIIKQRSYIETVCADDTFILTTNTDAVINVWESSDPSRPIFSIPFFTSSVRCAALSSPFLIACCATKDCTIILISLSDGSIVRSIDLEGRRAESLIITPGWGFIVAHLSWIASGTLRHSLVLFSVNGKKIKEVPLESGVQIMSSYKDEDGFDFIIVVNEAGSVYHFEVFPMVVGDSIVQLDDRVAALNYVAADHIIVCVTFSGKAVFIPIN